MSLEDQSATRGGDALVRRRLAQKKATRVEAAQLVGRPFAGRREGSRAHAWRVGYSLAAARPQRQTFGAVPESRQWDGPLRSQGSCANLREAVRHAARSTSLRRAGAWIRPKSPIPPGSLSHKLHAAEMSAIDTAEVAQDIWFENWGKGLDLWELARHYRGSVHHDCACMVR